MRFGALTVVARRSQPPNRARRFRTATRMKRSSGVRVSGPFAATSDGFVELMGVERVVRPRLGAVTASAGCVGARPDRCRCSHPGTCWRIRDRADGWGRWEAWASMSFSTCSLTHRASRRRQARAWHLKQSCEPLTSNFFSFYHCDCTTPCPDWLKVRESGRRSSIPSNVLEHTRILQGYGWITGSPKDRMHACAQPDLSSSVRGLRYASTWQHLVP